MTKSCPKCEGSVPTERDICPHCGLVFQKWEAWAQRAGMIEPIPEQESPGPKPVPKHMAKQNLSYLVGWVGGVLPFIAVFSALYHFASGYRRKAFQALVAAWWVLPVMLAQKLLDFRVTNSHDLIMVSILLATLFLVRKLDWPLNAPSPNVGSEPEPRDTQEYFRSRRRPIGVGAVVLVVSAIVGYMYPFGTNLIFLLFSPVVLYGFYTFVKAIRGYFGSGSWTQYMDNTMWTVGAFCFLLIFVGVLERSATVAKKRMQPVVSAVEVYHAGHGRYPESMDDLIPKYLTKTPVCQTSVYYWQHDDGSYSLVCHYFLFTRLAYDSNGKKWYSYD